MKKFIRGMLIRGLVVAGCIVVINLLLQRNGLLKPVYVDAYTKNHFYDIQIIYL